MSLWDTTALPGLYQRFHDGDGAKFHVEKAQDVAPILERNRRLRNLDDGFNAERDGRRVASIPVVVWHQWLAEGMDPNDMDALKAKLRDPEWAYLRTSEGAV